MNYTNYKITLDMHKVQSQISIPVPQNDTARRLYIHLFHNGKRFALEDGMRAVFAGEKADGTVLYNDCVIENQSVIRYDFTEQTTAVSGTLHCQIRVYGEDGILITSPNLTIVVYESVFSANQITSSNEYTALNQLMQEANEMLNDVHSKLENGEFMGKSGVYVGSGEMPEGFNVQIDPMAELCFEAGVPRVLYLDENGDFSLLNAGEGFDIENGTIVAVGDEKTRERVALLETKVDDLLYEPISITSFTVNPSTAEKGASVSQPYCSWKLNKKATAITLDGESVSPELGGFSLMRYNIKENTTFTLKVTDERGHSETKTATLSFMNGIYYGVSSIPTTLDSAFIRTLTKTLRSNKLPSFTVNAGAGQYIWYCLPKAYGACSFTVGGFSGGFALVDTISYKNAYGHTEDYYVYRSDHESLGQTAVTVA